MKKHALPAALGMTIVLLFLGDAAKLYRLVFVQYLDAKRYDYRLLCDRAELRLRNLLGIAAQGKLYAVSAERVAHYRNSPPGQSWGGVFVFNTK